MPNFMPTNYRQGLLFAINLEDQCVLLAKLGRKQRNQVAEWYGSMETSSAGAWDHMRKGFSDAYKVLEDAREKAENEFRSKEYTGLTTA